MLSVNHWPQNQITNTLPSLTQQDIQLTQTVGVLFSVYTDKIISTIFSFEVKW